MRPKRLPTTPAPPRNWPPSWGFPAHAEPFVPARAAVVTTDGFASDAGARVLREGGNAVDAAVAAAFALAVVNPEAGNVGGGGFLLLRSPGGDAHALDFRTRAPLAATPDMFLEPGGGVAEAAVLGPLAAGVPGSVSGLWEAHRRFGRRPWRALVEPAVRLARGFLVGERFARSFTPAVVEGLARFAGSARIFLPDGRPPRPGETFEQPELARTLERIRDFGPDGFYAGETADLIVSQMQREGGLITLEDLASYRSLWREPVRFEYRGHPVLSMPPSSSGGITLALTAAILEAFDVGALPWHGAEHLHLLAEAWRRAYADRNHYLADPAYAEIPLETLASPGYGGWRAADISPGRATPSSEVSPGVEAYASQGEGGHTTHLSVVDGEGAAVSLTTTINSWYGGKVTVEGAGVLLNNDMDDFTARPGTPNQFGLVQGEVNRIEPGKRMLSAMTPTIVLDPEERLLLVVGTPGGSSIITTVWQVVSGVIDHRLPLAQAVDAPRVHHQHLPDRMDYEPGGLPKEVLEELRGLGHALHEKTELSGDVQAILVHPGGSVEGRSDPRRGGTAAGYGQPERVGD
jgi:gamma-glutamyltranspeptidase / glutathione hydrolase